MKVISFGILEALEGKSEELKDLIYRHMEFVKEQPGLVHIYTARPKGNQEKFLVVSAWDTEENQQAAMAKLSSDPTAAASLFNLCRS
ncbi:hypothetical protein N752_27485 [Desulforamulus aquiferis]|nr:antibiotic biosynthesis monooxygenase [Desulforamulus aquiferis]RYD01870.1 hypothetical protein N752_27485 [Desulforamulus aquiferis]